MFISNPIENLKPLWTWLVGISRVWQEPLWKGFRWFLFTMLFGLSQMWLVLGVYYCPWNPRNWSQFFIESSIALIILIGITLYSQHLLRRGFLAALIVLFLVMWTLLAKNNFIPRPDVPLENFIRDGAILFLSIAIVSSLAMDYYVFTSKTMFSRASLNISAFIFFPIILIYGAAGFFTFCYLAPNEIEINSIFYTDLAFFGVTFIYTLFIKAKAFAKEQEQLGTASNS